MTINERTKKYFGNEKKCLEYDRKLLTTRSHCDWGRKMWMRLEWSSFVVTKDNPNYELHVYGGNVFTEKSFSHHQTKNKKNIISAFASRRHRMVTWWAATALSQCGAVSGACAFDWFEYDKRICDLWNEIPQLLYKSTHWAAGWDSFAATRMLFQGPAPQHVLFAAGIPSAVCFGRALKIRNFIRLLLDLIIRFRVAALHL